jgi:translation elongation factor EF-Ts
MCNNSKDRVRHIRELSGKTGCGLFNAAAAYDRAKGDLKLAEGYIHYQGCAINVYPRDGETRKEAYDRWVEIMARKWANNVY